MAIAISNPGDYAELLENLFAGEEGISLEQLKFNGMKGFSVKVEGSRYKSTVTPGLMRGLLELQDEIMRTVCELRFGVRDLRKLPDCDKQELELLFQISKGSSEADQVGTDDWFERVKGFLLEAMDGMDSKHKALVLGVLILGAGGVFSWHQYLEHQQGIVEMQLESEREKGEQDITRLAIEQLAETQREANEQLAETQRQAIEELSESNERLSELTKRLIKEEKDAKLTRMSQITRDGLEAGYKHIIEHVPDATHITVGGVRLNRTAMDFIAAKPEPTREVNEETELVHIDGINRKGESDYRVIIESPKYGQISLLLEHDYIPDSHFDYLYSAFKGKRTVKVAFQVATTDSRTNKARLLKVLDVPERYQDSDSDDTRRVL
ncbi:hypothetical protein JF541_01265 [Marinobacter hydrocarbonoclasticus]|uniref:hypothetical protein n=1 Tax=Marinobacter nauticus TaxID=2743 RepID=UPI001A8E735D|nr:hypothetical protein [Marinobacter nauticus]MBN8237760.1 hypothetical protein [Marinobacter nauticus]